MRVHKGQRLLPHRAAVGQGGHDGQHQSQQRREQLMQPLAQRGRACSAGGRRIRTGGMRLMICRWHRVAPRTAREAPVLLQTAKAKHLEICATRAPDDLRTSKLLGPRRPLPPVYCPNPGSSGCRSIARHWLSLASACRPNRRCAEAERAAGGPASASRSSSVSCASDTSSSAWPCGGGCGRQGAAARGGARTLARRREWQCTFTTCDAVLTCCGNTGMPTCVQAAPVGQCWRAVQRACSACRAAGPTCVSALCGPSCRSARMRPGRDVRYSPSAEPPVGSAASTVLSAVSARAACAGSADRASAASSSSTGAAWCSSAALPSSSCTT